MKLSQFQFNLPAEKIAKEPPRWRDECKLMVLDRKTGEIEHKLFKNIIERSDFVDKDIQISPDYGYRFVSRNQDRTLLDGSDLSSGEQHFLIQTYELIFNAQENSLALIDEPEMSFHIIWQMDFLRNIREIAK